jgi:hypothetical protein
VSFITANLLLLIDSSRRSIDIQINHREFIGAFKLDEADNGWIWRRGVDDLWRRMCWLPYKRRHGGMIRACFGQKVVITAGSGLLTILEFPDLQSV